MANAIPLQLLPTIFLQVGYTSSISLCSNSGILINLLEEREVDKQYGPVIFINIRLPRDMSIVICSFYAGFSPLFFVPP